ncbi:MAG: fibro-slime domain-containing protein [Myxococcota bacterium]
MEKHRLKYTILLLGAAGCTSAPIDASGTEILSAGPVTECTDTVRAVIRDFRADHPDFQRAIGAQTGIVESWLGSDGLPVYAPEGATRVTEGAASFDQWYRDVTGINERFEVLLPLTVTDTGSRVYDNPEYFPIDGVGYGDTAVSADATHNFHFTTEIHEYFVYNGREEFHFRGDDDVWVFVNGYLVIDLGGVHPPMTASVRFDEIAAQAGLTLGGVYRFDVFHAERHTTKSSLRFETSACFIPDVDEDGVVSSEDCDDEDPSVGRLLYENNFLGEDGYFQNTSTLTDEWAYSGGALRSTRGGQQALLGASASWENTVTYARVSSQGFEHKCSNCGFKARSVTDGSSFSRSGRTYDFDESGVFRIDRAADIASIYGAAFDASGTPQQVHIDMISLGREGDDELFSVVSATFGAETGAAYGLIRFGMGLLIPEVYGVSGAFVFTETESSTEITLNVFERDRFRVGILARAALDEDQDEGFHGYRCAVARNSEIDCARPGRFVQLATFMDLEEDDVRSECIQDCGANTTFDELQRRERSLVTDVLQGDSALITFRVFDNELLCSFTGIDGETVETRAEDTSFRSGTTGLSTLNAFGAFDSIKVCEALSAERGAP